MATLKTRIAALEAAIDDDRGGGFDFAPVMAVEEWEIAARLQQAELCRAEPCREVSNGKP